MILFCLDNLVDQKSYNIQRVMYGRRSLSPEEYPHYNGEYILNYEHFNKFIYEH